MIVYFLLSGLGTVLSAVFGWLPSVTTIPFVDSYLVTGFSYLHYITLDIPPIGIALAGFIWVLGFKMTMFLLRVFRVLPASN